MKPVNTTAESIIYAHSNNPTISIKADGCTKIIKLKTWELECEYIEDLDLYLVFDVLNYKFRHKNTLIDRMNWIRSMHSMQIPQYECFTSLKQVKASIDKDSKILNKYLRKTNDAIRWFPKICFKVDFSFDEWCELLTYEPDIPYNTDGWIINSLQTYKYKPLKHLTADLDICNDIGTTSDGIKLEVKGSGLSGICRCRWVGIWKAYEVRVDKKYPNPSRVVNQIEWLIHNQYDLRKLSKYTKRPYYSETNIKLRISPHEERFLNISNEIFAKNLLEIVRRHPITNVLDIGCGNCKLRNKIVRNIVNLPIVTGIDCDPKCINVCRSKSHRDKWYTGDMNILGFKMDMFQMDIDNTFDLVVLNNTIHYSTNVVYENIDKFTHLGSIVYIYGYDFDKITKDQYNYFGISLNINRDRKEMIFTYPWLDKQGVDKIFSFSEIEYKLERFGFTKIALPNVLGDNNIEILDLHTTLIMKKSHIKNI